MTPVKKVDRDWKIVSEITRYGVEILIYKAYCVNCCARIVPLHL